MIIYFLIFPIITIFYIFPIRNYINRRKFFVSLSFLFLTIVAVFRASTVGADVPTYEGLFVQLLSGESTGHGNTPIYNLYSQLVGKVSAQPLAITIANSIVICVLMAVFIYYSDVNPFYATLLFVGMYFYADSLNGARQYIAIALVLNAFLFLLKRKWIWYISLTLIAIGVHATAIVSLIYIPIVLIRWTLKKSIIFIGSLVVLGLLYLRIIDIFVKIFPRYSFYITGDGYENVQTIGTVSQGKILYYYLFLLTVFLITVFLINKYRILITTDETKIIICYAISLFVGILFYNAILVQRVIWYFSIWGIIFFPIMEDKLSKIFSGGKRDSKFLFVLFFLIVFVVYIIRLQNNYDMIVPYRTWIS